MSRPRIKKEVLSVLNRYSSDQLIQKLSSYEPKQLIGPLFSALCNPAEHIRWNAVHAFGEVVHQLANLNLEGARVVMRRFLWSLNDESGGIGWGSPEAMAMIMCQNRALRREYLHMLISYMRPDGGEAFQDGNFLELPMLQRGLLWGIGLLLQNHNEEMAVWDIGSDLMAYLDSDDPYVQGLAIRAISFLPALPPLLDIEPFLQSNKLLNIYTGEGMVDVQLRDLAGNLIKKMM